MQTALDLMYSTLKLKGILPPEFHRAAFAVAKKEKDTNLLRALIARPDAPTDLVDLYSKDNRLPVRVAYLTRPGWDPARLAAELASETRAGVLSEVFSKAKDVKVRSVIEQTFLAKPTKTLAKLLIESSSDPVKFQALKTLGSDFDTPYAYPSDLGRKIVAAADSLALSDPTKLCSLFDNSILLKGVISNTQAPLECLIKAIDSTFSAIYDKNRTPLYSYYPGLEYWVSTVTALNALLAARTEPELISCILALRRFDMADDINFIFQEFLASNGLIGDESDVSTPSGRMYAAIFSRDPDLLASIVTLPHIIHEGNLISRIFQNPALPVESALALIKMYHSRAIPFWLVSDFAERNKADLDVLDFVYTYYPTMFSKFGLSLYPDPSTATARLTQVIGSKFSQRELAACFPLLSSLADSPSFDMDTFFENAPWALLTHPNIRYYNLDAVFIALTNREADIFGDDPAAWENFSVLASDFTGSAADLLRAAAALA